MKFNTVVICGDELVSFEVGEHLKVVAVKLDQPTIKKAVDKLTKHKITNLVVTTAIQELMNKETQKTAKAISKNYHVEDALDFTTI